MAFQKIHTVTNPTLDANGRFTEVFREMERVADAGIISMTGGYVGFIQGISGATVTVEVRRTAAGAHAAAAGGPEACAGATVGAHVLAGGGGAASVALAAGLFTDSGAGGNVAHTVSAQPTITHANIVAGVADHGAAVLAALGAGAIVAVIRILAEGI